MQYTVQQLQGGPKYSHKTRIGNWNEDMEIQVVKKTDFDLKTTMGQLPNAKAKNHLEDCYTKVPWSFSQDGCLKSGDFVMLKNKKTDGWLAFNTQDRMPGVDECYTLTTTTEAPGPVKRAMFMICKAEKMDIFGSDDIIRYGQKVKIVSNPYAFKKNLFVASNPKGANTYSPVSRHQEASMHAKDDYMNNWIIDWCDPNDRLEYQGQPVRASDPILLRHCQTQHYLASDNVRYKTCFGGEKEVSCNSFAQLNKTQNLALEGKGSITTDVPTKFQQDQNVFFFVTAPNASYAAPIEDLTKFNIEDLVAEVKAKLLQRSSGGIKGIGRIFRAMDDNGNHQLDLDDFRWGFIDYGFNLTKEEAQHLLNYFDKDGNGTVSYDEFLRALKGDINADRKRWIKAAYDKLDVNKDGLVKLDDIAQIYDASEHPEVIQGKKTPEEVFAEFMTQWDTQEQDGIVTFDEFMDYYEGVSCSIDRDDYFALMMQRAWKL